MTSRVVTIPSRWGTVTGLRAGVEPARRGLVPVSSANKSAPCAVSLKTRNSPSVAVGIGYRDQFAIQEFFHVPAETPAPHFRDWKNL